MNATRGPTGGEARRESARASVDWWNCVSRSTEIYWTRAAGLAVTQQIAKRRTAALIEFARARSPFYRDAWKSAPEGRVALADLPVVTKRELMARFDDWVTDPSVERRRVDEFLADREQIGERFMGRYVIWKSSGSTGEPGIYLQDDAALSTYDALLAVQLESAQVIGQYAWGVMRGGRAALIAAMGDHFASIASWERVCRGSPWPRGRAFSVTAPVPELVDALNAYQPAFLASYPTTLEILALERVEGRLRIAPSCLWSGGEYLSDHARTMIQRAFGTTLVNEYGASECMSMAVSCRHGALHVNSDWVVLEPVDRDYRPVPPGTRSDTVLLTNLANRVQPIIRYDLGDSVTVSDKPCRCGSRMPAIQVDGRRDDVLALRTEDGRLVQLSPLAVTTIIEDATSRRFQLVQTAPDRLALRIAVDDPLERDREWQAVRNALRAYLDRQSLDGVDLELDPIAPVQDERSGKFREVIAQASARAQEPRAGTAA
jgi:phenylacetate-coenzyme A ligase PaaK-like adenylate-forming protein